MSGKCSHCSHKKPRHNVCDESDSSSDENDNSCSSHGHHRSCHSQKIKKEKTCGKCIRQEKKKYFCECEKQCSKKCKNQEEDEVQCTPEKKECGKCIIIQIA